MEQDWRIRPATASDLDALVAITVGDPHSSWTRQSFASELTVAWSHVEVVESHEVIGLIVWWNVAGELELLEIATHPQHRRRGVARYLIEHLLAEARARDAQRVLLEVRRDNVAARALYEQVGFVVVGERRGYYAGGEDAILMDWRAA